MPHGYILFNKCGHRFCVRPDHYEAKPNRGKRGPKHVVINGFPQLTEAEKRRGMTYNDLVEQMKAEGYQFEPHVSELEQASPQSRSSVGGGRAGSLRERRGPWTRLSQPPLRLRAPGALLGLLELRWAGRPLDGLHWPLRAHRWL